MRIALAQMNPVVGDLVGNATKILEAAQFATEDDVDLVVFPAHAITGWPLEGMSQSRAFLDAAKEQLERIAAESPVSLLLSMVVPVDLGNGFFQAMPELYVIEHKRPNSLGIPMMAEEDESFGIEFGCDGISIYLDDHFHEVVAEEGDTVLLEVCADTFDSPYALPVARGNLERLQGLARDSGRFVVYANLTGGADDAVFSGGSCVLNPRGELLANCSACKQELVTFDTKPLEEPEIIDPSTQLIDERELIWNSAVMATRDYMNKNKFADAVIGLSGGIDSAIVAAIAADAIGGEYVHGVLMPGKYSSQGSIDDSLSLARNLGINTIKLPINDAVESLSDILSESCGGSVSGLAAENLQARIRTLYLMTLSNAHGWMVLNTGNKSEAAMGFSTLYGDTAGAFAPVGDLYKTQIYELARWRAAQSPSIPMESIEKAPSAELYEDAQDADRLPPYDVLDALLAAHIEGGMGTKELLAEGFDSNLVNDTLKAVKRNEYKRRSEPVAPHFGGISLTKQRAWPITNAWEANYRI